MLFSLLNKTTAVIMNEEKVKLVAIAVGGVGVISLLASVIIFAEDEPIKSDEFNERPIMNDKSNESSESPATVSQDLGWTLLRDLTSPLRRFADSAKRPCSNLTAAFLLSIAGLAPKSNPTSRSAWQAQNEALWKNVNIWDASQPWSGGQATVNLIGGKMAPIYRSITIETAPELARERWHQIQVWSRAGERVIPKPKGPDTGHSYLVWVEQDGSTVIVDSGTKRGLRIKRKLWYTPGRDYQVVSLPAL